MSIFDDIADWFSPSIETQSPSSIYPYDIFRWMHNRIGNKNNITHMIDYARLISDMSPEAFSYCVGLLYPLLGYSVLKLEDVRKADVLEKLHDIIDFLPNDTSYSEQAGTLDWYCAVIVYKLEGIKAVSDTTADRYLKKIKQLVEHLLKNKYTLEDLEDINALYLSAIRSYKEQYQRKISTKAIETKDDLLWEYYWRTHFSMTDFSPGIILQDAENITKKRGVVKPSDCHELTRDDCFRNGFATFDITLAILLSRGLQKIGAFDKEE